MKMKIRLILLFIGLIIALVSTAQQDSLKYRILPTNEYSLLISAGKTSANKYIDIHGKSFFEPHKNLSVGFQLMYSRYLNKNFKLSTGIGFYGQEYSFIMKFDENDLPGISKYIPEGEFNSGTYALFSTPLDYGYITFPLHIEMQLLPNTKRNEVWLYGGVDFQWFTHSQNRFGHSLIIDSNAVKLLNTEYLVNPLNKLNTTLEFGGYYSFSIASAHKLRIGFKSRISFNNQVEGTFDFLPEFPEYYANGTFTNKMSYFGIDVGYSFNNRNNIYRKSNYYIHHKKNETIKVDSIDNQWELEFGVGLFGLPFVNNNQVSGKINVTVSPDKFSRLSTHIKKYRNENTAWVSGVEFNVIHYETKPHPQFLSLIYLDIPFKIHKDLKTSKEMHFFYEGGLDLLIHLTDYHVTMISQEIDSTGLPHNVLITNISNSNWLGIGINAGFGFFIETKHLNKFSLVLNGNYSLTKAYSVDYSLLQNDGSFFNNSFIIRPAIISLDFKYGITWKRYRYLKSH